MWDPTAEFLIRANISSYTVGYYIAILKQWNCMYDWKVLSHFHYSHRISTTTPQV